MSPLVCPPRFALWGFDSLAGLSRSASDHPTYPTRAALARLLDVADPPPSPPVHIGARSPEIRRPMPANYCRARDT